MECVLQLFGKYLEKCLWEHLFELCFSLSHDKNNCPNKCSKICSTPNIALHALPSGVVSSYVTVRKEESQQETSGRKRNGTISLKIFLILGDERKRTHVVGKGVIKRVFKQTEEIWCIKPNILRALTSWMGSYFFHFE